MLSKTKINKTISYCAYCFSVTALTLLASSCSSFTNKNNENLARPPQKISTSTAAAAAAAAPAKANSSAASKSAKVSPQARIQEKKGDGGEVEEVKVNNRNNVPPYYIYPNRGGVDANAPSSDTVSTPNWKISW